MYKKPAVSADSVRKSSSSGAESNGQLEPVDRAAEKNLVRKCDLHVLPPVALLYMLAFLDRINIGNARIQDLEKDLNMKGQDFNIALCVFFILYIICEVPSNLLLREIAPSTWLSLIMVCWGMVMNLINFDARWLICEHRNHHCMHGLYPDFYWTSCMQDLPRNVRSRFFSR